VIGIGCRFPGGADDPAAFWRILREGRDTVGDVPAERWDTQALFDADLAVPGKMNARQGGFLARIDGFDAGFFGISPREAAALDPQQRLLLEVAWEALEHAGIAPDRLRGSSTGVFVGMSTHDYSGLQLHAGELDRLGAYDGTGNALSAGAGRLSYFFDWRGPSLTVDTACSSSLVAAHLACRSLRAGESSLALAGGVNLVLSPELSVAFTKAGMLSPDSRCRSFDASANGFVRAEGCGFVVLRRLSDALAAGDTVLAVIKGSAVNQDGRSNGLTAPSGPAQEQVIAQALADAGLSGAEIDYVEAHGSGTALGDPIEAQALGAALGADRPRPLLLGSLKTNFGHLEAAAGVAGLAKVVLALHHREVPPSLHFATPSPHIPWARLSMAVPTQATPWPQLEAPRRAGVSSFGFTGTNAHLVLEQAPERISEAAPARGLHLLPLSAADPAALGELVGRYAAVLQADGVDVAGICATAALGRSHLAERLAVVGKDAAALAQALLATRAQTPAAVAPPPVCFLFTGQGSPYPGMGLALYRHEPVFRRALDQCDSLLRRRAPGRSWTRWSRTRPRWRRPAGHSRLCSRSSMRLPRSGVPGACGRRRCSATAWRVRGRLHRRRLQPGRRHQADCRTRPADAGAPCRRRDDGRVRRGGGGPPRCSRRIPSFPLAAVNGPEEVVVSGSLDALGRLAAALDARGLAYRPLAVSHAFHSALMEPMLAEFGRVLAGVRLHPPSLPLVSNLTGALAGAEVAEPEYWLRHLRQPVRFAAGLGGLATGHRHFLEIGPQPVLCGLGRKLISGCDTLWLPSLRERTDDVAQMLGSLALLYGAGVEVDWEGFHREFPQRRAVLPAYPWTRERHWVAAPSDRPRATGHPLLGVRLPEVAALPGAIVWDAAGRVRRDRLPDRRPGGGAGGCDPADDAGGGA
jgi:acyl transferase domain-containing protein